MLHHDGKKMKKEDRFQKSSWSGLEPFWVRSGGGCMKEEEMKGSARYLYCSGRRGKHLAIYAIIQEREGRSTFPESSSTVGG